MIQFNESSQTTLSFSFIIFVVFVGTHQDTMTLHHIVNQDIYQAKSDFLLATSLTYQ